MTKAEICAYFERIGLEYNSNDALDVQLLKRLQYAHVTSVPYECTDIVDHRPLSLEPADLYQKIVVERRGGYCFELNGLFGELLRSLGFEVDEYMARFLRGEKEIPKRRHRVLSVKVGDERYLCDVGVGNRAPRYPLLIKAGVIQEQFGECYRFETDDFLGWVITECIDGEWGRYFSFTQEKQLNKDFYTPSFYCENHPDSPFLKNMLSIKTADGRITIDGNTFKIRKGENIVTEKQLTSEDLDSCCRNYYGMALHREL